MAQKILVTGASGFTGGSLAKRLLAEHPGMVRVMVRDEQQGQPWQALGAEVAYGDLRDADSVKRAMGGINLVYHIGALFRPSKATRQDMWDVNVTGVQNMLDAAEAVGVDRFVHCSTGGVHGDIKNPPANEESPFNPGDHYQESKLEGEQLAWRYIKEQRLPISIFRPAGIYGPGDLRFLKMVRGIQKGIFFIVGDGKTGFHMVYIDDLVDGIIRCGTVDKAVGNVYILAGDDTQKISINDLTATVAGIIGKPPPRLYVPYWPVYYAGLACEIICTPLGINPPLYRRRVDFFKKTRAFNISKARRDLGYAPKVGLDEGMTNTINWYRQQGLIN